MRLTAVMNKWQPLRHLGIVLGCLIAACSINLFVVPSHLLTGGVTGIAMIIYYLAELPIGLQTFIYNIPLLIASYKLLGKNYTIDVIIGTVVFSFCLDATRFLNAYAPADDLMLASVYGGVFNGIGYGIVFRMNGSTGGFDILGAIIKKYYSMNMGTVIFGFNCVIVTIAGVLFGIEPAMFTLVCMYTNSIMTDKVIAGLNRSKTVLIVSEKSKEIADGIMNEIKRGVTFLHGQGAFSGDERNIVMVVVSLTQIAKLKIIVHTLDRNAFMLIMSASEVVGRGFSRPSRTKKIPVKDQLSPEVEEKLQKALRGGT
ncbi:MAG: YitT family protein [Selenomonadaceae bacterium]|nr:YitT family protein [Selenomonadaceae bacterium]